MQSRKVWLEQMQKKKLYSERAMQSKKIAVQIFAFSKNNAVSDFVPPHFYIQLNTCLWVM